MNEKDYPQGSRLPLLKAGDQFPVEASFWNPFLKTINALRNLRVVYADGITAPTFKISDNNAVLLLPPVDSQSGISSAILKCEVLDAHSSEDYLSCEVLEGTLTGSTINVYRPEWLRASIDSFTFPDFPTEPVTFTYSDTQHRVASRSGYSNVSQAISPPYVERDEEEEIVGSYVYAGLVDNGGDGYYIEVSNTRSWISVPYVPIP